MHHVKKVFANQRIILLLERTEGAACCLPVETTMIIVRFSDQIMDERSSMRLSSRSGSVSQ